MLLVTPFWSVFICMLILVTNPHTSFRHSMLSHLCKNCSAWLQAETRLFFVIFSVSATSGVHSIYPYYDMIKQVETDLYFMFYGICVVVNNTIQKLNFSRRHQKKIQYKFKEHNVPRVQFELRLRNVFQYFVRFLNFDGCWLPATILQACSSIQQLSVSIFYC